MAAEKEPITQDSSAEEGQPPAPEDAAPAPEQLDAPGQDSSSGGIKPDNLYHE